MDGCQIRNTVGRLSVVLHFVGAQSYRKWLTESHWREEGTAVVRCAGVLFYCIAPTKRHYQCAEIALNCGADVNNTTRQGTSILTFASETAKNNEELCLALLDAGADPTVADEVKLTAQCLVSQITLDATNSPSLHSCALSSRRPSGRQQIGLVNDENSIFRRHRCYYVPWLLVCLSNCHSNGRIYRHDFFCIRQPQIMSKGDYAIFTRATLC